MSPRTPTPAHRAEYALFSGVAALARGLPDGARDRLGAALGRVAYGALGVRREVVERQLRRAFPERDEAWVRRTARASYEHLGREALALLKLASLGPEDVIARTEVEGLEGFREALGAGRGLVLVTGHFGNWEIGGSALAARGIPLDGVAQPQSNPLFDRALTDARERLGMRVIRRSRGARPSLRALRDGRVVAFVADQDARRAGVFAPFFGRSASTHRGPALLALRTGAPLFLGTAPRAAGGRYLVRLERIEVAREGETDKVVRRLTAAFTARLEAAVREAPEQYFWQHRRWKTTPPDGRATSDRTRDR